MSLTKKIDFALIISVQNANPNGDPLNGNRPRADFSGFGEMTDVCLKRKIRDRLQDAGESIFVQSDEKKTDGMTSLANRAKDKDVGLGADAFNAKKANKDETAKKACEKWLDVRSFGQVFAFGKSDDASGVSIAVRGPVTIQSPVTKTTFFAIVFSVISIIRFFVSGGIRRGLQLYGSGVDIGWGKAKNGAVFRDSAD